MDALVEWVANARSVLVFTGAGMSTGSGIPDFRGPQGVWRRRQPVYFQDFVAHEASRVEYWEYKLEGFEGFRAAQPNAAHLALAELERLGRLDTLVTQNIDGLHALAGNSDERLIELHGTNRLVGCLSCGHAEPPDRSMEEFRATRRPPRCRCGGLLKSATVSFGQDLPAEALQRAFEAAERADVVISAGSTLEVTPAAHVPLRAARHARYAILNRGATAHDDVADLRLDGDLQVLLPDLVRRLRTG